MIERVDRADDPRVSDYSRVGQPLWLRDAGLFVAEGRFVVQRLLAARRFRVRSLLVTPTALSAIEPDADPAITIYVAERPVLASITGFDFHRGCLALAERPLMPPLEALVGDRLLALEGIGNPDNMGGLFRVAAAFGVCGVLLDPTSGDPLYRKAIRTSMGAALTVPFTRIEQWPNALRDLQARGYNVLALTPRLDAPPITTVTPAAFARFVLLVGAEGAGLTDAALRAADMHLRISMAPGVDSLNVTVAAGIALSRLT